MMTSIKEAYENMKSYGKAMQLAAELFSPPVFVPTGTQKKWKSINDVREKMGMDRLYSDDEVLNYVKADVEATHAFIEGLGDTRYNEPKAEPKASEEEIEETILTTEIYRQARLAVIRDNILTPEARSAILMVQGKQVAYGIDKYPEPLNANTWDTSETIDHILDESIDKLHYLVMLRIKLEQALVSGAYNDTIAVRNANSRIATITRMIESNIEEMGYLVKLNELIDNETEARPNDSMDALAYTMRFVGDKGVNLVKNYGADNDGDTLRVFSDDEKKEPLFKPVFPNNAVPLEHVGMYTELAGADLDDDICNCPMVDVAHVHVRKDGAKKNE